MKKKLDLMLIDIGQQMYSLQREEQLRPDYPRVRHVDPRIAQLKAQHSLVCFLIKLFELTTRSARPQGQSSGKKP